MKDEAFIGREMENCLWFFRRGGKPIIMLFCFYLYRNLVIFGEMIEVV